MLAVVPALRERAQPLEVLYLGSASGLDRQLVERAGLPFVGLDVRGVVGQGRLRQALRLGRVGLATLRAVAELRAFRPDVMLATGGYVSVPAVLAGRWLGVPSLVFLPDRAPGVAVRFLARFATRLALTFPQSRALLPGADAVVTGCPARPGLQGGDRAAARARLGFAPDLPLVLVTGGSQGAHSINLAVKGQLQGLAALAQWLHAAGPADTRALELARAQLPATLRPRYRVAPFLHETMDDALLAADLCVARAGASTLAELALAGLPSLLVPYPHANRHQEANAAVFAQAGAARVLLDAQLAEGALLPAVRELLEEPGRLAAMRAAAAALARPDAAAAIAREVLELAQP